MSIRVEVKNGIIMESENPRTAYFGWPTVAKLADGTIVTGCSGLRCEHVCPWGKSVVAYSKDGGETYGDMEIVHNDMIDNRDLGVVAMGGQKYAITWFSTDVRIYDMQKWMRPEDYPDAKAYMDTWTDDTAQTLAGSWMKITEDGGKTWTRAISVPVSTPHGFSMLKDGTLGYLGKGFSPLMQGTNGNIDYAVSKDGGFTWQVIGTVPLPDGRDQYHEPHVIELDDGSLLGAIRYHVPKEQGGGIDCCITYSKDGGKTWTPAKRLNVMGTPPHLMKHSSGAIVMVYGYRSPAYGQRAIVSWDNGVTWSDEIILRDDAPNGDLGYPASIELDDGSIYTVYYQVNPGHGKTSVMWSRWNLPEKR